MARGMSRVLQRDLTPGYNARGRVDAGSDMYAYIPAILNDAESLIRARIARKHGVTVTQRRIPTDFCDFIEDRFYVPSTLKPAVLAPHQRAIMKLALDRNEDGDLPYRTFIYSTIKQSGKSTMAGMVLRWYAETQQRYAELYAIGNDLGQATGRSFREVRTSIELMPGYDAGRKRLPDEWSVYEQSLRCTRTGTVIRPLAVDAKGEAGGKPAIQVWTELWGYEHQEALRFWDELTPIPTIPDSMRIVETYAGYEQESILLLSLYDLGMKSHQLTAGELAARTGTEIGVFEESQHPDDPVPIWEDKLSRQLMYWDSGVAARRMPWQKGTRGEEYYKQQEASLHPKAYRRLHLNEWTTSEGSFIPEEVYDACFDASIEPIEPGSLEPLVMGVDAATTGDSFAIVIVSRHHVRTNDVAVRAVKVFDPREQKGGRVDYDEAEAFIRFVCEGGCANRHPRSLAPMYSDAERCPDQENFPNGCPLCRASSFEIPGHNIVQIAYDPYQLEQMMGRIRKDSVAWCESFSQAGDRLIADRGLYDLIIGRRLSHRGSGSVSIDRGASVLRNHILNAGVRLQKDQDSTMRLIKVSQSRKIDAAVALSMASFRCVYLSL